MSKMASSFSLESNSISSSIPSEFGQLTGMEANLRFALSVEPANAALQARASEIAAVRAEGRPTVPTTIGLELETNPFLRPSSAALRAHVGVPDGESDEECFARIRKLKDNF